MPQRRTHYASVGLVTDLRDQLQRDALALSAELGRRLSMSDVVRAWREVAAAHPDELRAALAADDREGTDQ